MDGGFRAPSPEPDDDHDGRVDEDRLDGVDNDGDGSDRRGFRGDRRRDDGDLLFRAGDRGIGRAARRSSGVLRVGAAPHRRDRHDESLDQERRVGPARRRSHRRALRKGRAVLLLELGRVAARANGMPRTRASSSARISRGRTTGLVIFPENGWTGDVVGRRDRESTGTTSPRFSAGSRGAPAGAGGRWDFTACRRRSRMRPFSSRKRPASTDAASCITPRRIWGRSSPAMRSASISRSSRSARGPKSRPRRSTRSRPSPATDRFAHLPPPVSMTPRVLWGSYRPIEGGAAGAPAGGGGVRDAGGPTRSRRTTSLTSAGSPRTT